MSTDTTTRRSFLKVGALMATPLAAAPAVAAADGGLKARLDRLEGEKAVRDLHQAWLRRVNAGDAEGAASLFAYPGADAIEPSMRGIAHDHAADLHEITLAADGASATGRFACTVEVETELARDCTLAQMAHAQGGGFVHESERRVLNAEYVKSGGVWGIARVAFAPA